MATPTYEIPSLPQGLYLQGSGGAEVGTVCNNPYSSYSYAGGMYSIPITGSNGEAVYKPTGNVPFGSDAAINSNSTSNFTNGTFYKLQSVVEQGNPPVPKSVYTSLNLINPISISIEIFRAQNLAQVLEQAELHAGALSFRLRKRTFTNQVGSFFVDFDQQNIIKSNKPIMAKPEQGKPAQAYYDYAVPFEIRQCGCFDSTVENKNSESSVVEGDQEALGNATANSANPASSTVSVEHILNSGEGGGAAEGPAQGIVMGYPYTIEVVKSTIPSTESDFDLAGAGGKAGSNGRFCVTGTYKISLPCPRIDKIETTIPKKPTTSKHNRAKRIAWEKKYGGAINTIKNIAIKPEDQVRYMTIY